MAATPEHILEDHLQGMSYDDLLRMREVLDNYIAKQQRAIQRDEVMEIIAKRGYYVDLEGKTSPEDFNEYRYHVVRVDCTVSTDYIFNMCGERPDMIDISLSEPQYHDYLGGWIIYYCCDPGTKRWPEGARLSDVQFKVEVDQFKNESDYSHADAVAYIPLIYQKQDFPSPGTYYVCELFDDYGAMPCRVNEDEICVDGETVNRDNWESYSTSRFLVRRVTD